jgi:hypothetical protein
MVLGVSIVALQCSKKGKTMVVSKQLFKKTENTVCNQMAILALSFVGLLGNLHCSGFDNSSEFLF